MRSIAKKSGLFLAQLVVLVRDFIVFNILLIIYVVSRVGRKVARYRWFPSKKIRGVFTPFVSRVTRVGSQKNTIQRLDLIDVAFRNMMSKQTRAMITMGGMAVGIGAIVFLVSLGYGVQNMVVERVARLEEISQADVFTQPGSLVRIDDQTLSEFSSIESVKLVLPLIAVVGRVNFQDSVSDMAVYGVTSEYLRESAVQPTQGTIFESDDLVADTQQGTFVTQDSASASAQTDDVIGKVRIALDEGSWLKVHSSPSSEGELLGYTKQEHSTQEADEVWGDAYISDDPNFSETGELLNKGKWVTAEFLLWDAQSCDESLQECEDSYVVQRDADGQQVRKKGYIAEIDMRVESQNSAVASDTFDLEALLTSDDASATADVDIQALLDQEKEALAASSVQMVALHSNAVKQAVVNQATLSVLGIPENEAVGKQFEVSFVATSDLLATTEEKVESFPTSYTIVGVVPGDTSPFFYVPFADVRGMG
ncbi:ABC transporter permease, partial [Candidatus Woesebacteria bacterium]|nr:ABC transporter permease [Candidatus Woesebacteria bacterium]